MAASKERQTGSDMRLPAWLVRSAPFFSSIAYPAKMDFANVLVSRPGRLTPPRRPDTIERTVATTSRRGLASHADARAAAHPRPDPPRGAAGGRRRRPRRRRPRRAGQALLPLPRA